MKLNAQNVCCTLIFMHLIFVVLLPQENILTTNISLIMVVESDIILYQLKKLDLIPSPILKSKHTNYK